MVSGTLFNVRRRQSLLSLRTPTHALRTSFVFMSYSVSSPGIPPVPVVENPRQADIAYVPFFTLDDKFWLKIPTYLNGSVAPGPVTRPEPGAEGQQGGPQLRTHGDQAPLALTDTEERVVESLLARRGRVSLALVTPNEARAIQSLSGRAAGYTRVRPIDPLRRLVIHSRTQTNITNIDAILNLTGNHPALRRAQRTESEGPDLAPAPETRPVAVVGVTLSRSMLVLVIGVAMLGGIFAGTVISIGPMRTSLLTCLILPGMLTHLVGIVFAIIRPFAQLSELIRRTSSSHSQSLPKLRTTIQMLLILWFTVAGLSCTQFI